MVNQNQDEWILAVGLEYISHFPHGKLWFCIEAWIETIISCFPFFPYSLNSTCNSHNLVTILKILTGATWCQCASEATLPRTNWSGTRKIIFLEKIRPERTNGKISKAKLRIWATSQLSQVSFRYLTLFFKSHSKELCVWFTSQNSLKLLNNLLLQFIFYSEIRLERMLSKDMI